MTRALIIGGGAAGMMASIFAAREGAQVTVLERNEKLGKKLYITGKGRCNVTNDCTVEAFMAQVPHNPKFLYHALYGFTPQQMMAFLLEAGCPVMVERGQRVFPVSQKASDVTRALGREMDAAGVKVRLSSRVKRLNVDNGHVVGVTLDNGQTLPADRVLLATGGCSYPATGSTGDGYPLAAALKHTMAPIRPALSALCVDVDWPKQLQGLALKNVELCATLKGKTVFKQLGEMLFTHFGISGPLVLELSSHLDAEPISQYEVTLDLKPGLTGAQLDSRLLRDFEENARKQWQSILPGLMPARLAAIFPWLCGLDPGIPVSQIKKDQRLHIAQTMKRLKVPIVGFAPIDEAIVTRGGVRAQEINPATMESKRVKGLYFAGEIMDVDAHTGGYNLHIAFATGALAGKCMAATE